jgi:predicted RNase H-like HicB family nuclease
VRRLQGPVGTAKASPAKGEGIEASARIVSGDAAAQTEAALADKYGLLRKMIGRRSTESASSTETGEPQPLLPAAPPAYNSHVRFTAAVTHEDPWYVARCLEVEVTSQGPSAEEALANLREALELYFEAGPRPEGIEAPIITAVDVSV